MKTTVNENDTIQFTFFLVMRLIITFFTSYGLFIVTLILFVAIKAWELTEETHPTLPLK